MVSTRSLAHIASALCLIFLHGRCDSKAFLPELNLHPSSDYQNFSSLEHKIILQPVIDVQEPRGFKQARDEGRRLDHNWDARRGADRTHPFLDVVFQNKYPVPAHLTDEQAQLLKLFDTETDTTTTEWAEYESEGSADGTSLNPSWKAKHLDGRYFKCEINAQSGTILVDNWRRNPDAAPSDVLDSDVLWAMWKDKVARMRGTGLDHLNMVFFDPVTEPKTLALAKYASGDDKKFNAYQFPRGDQDLDAAKVDTFWALIGSPAGATVMSMLTEHKHDLSMLRVNEIYVACNLETDPGPPRNQYAISFELVETLCADGEDDNE